jgi:DNA (cytosine-5)-methyltransferase 1
LQRLLTFDKRSKPVKFEVERLEGKCFIIPRSFSQAILTEDVFYLDTMEELSACHICSQFDDHSRMHGAPLMGMDLFSGAGGLSLGLESTGLIKTGWAVEFDESAARTFRSVGAHRSFPRD